MPQPNSLLVIHVPCQEKVFFCTVGEAFSLRYENEVITGWKDPVNLILCAARAVQDVPLEAWSICFAKYEPEEEGLDCDRITELLQSPEFIASLELTEFTPAMLGIEAE